MSVCLENKTGEIEELKLQNIKLNQSISYIKEKYESKIEQMRETEKKYEIKIKELMVQIARLQGQLKETAEDGQKLKMEKRNNEYRLEKEITQK